MDDGDGDEGKRDECSGTVRNEIKSKYRGIYARVNERIRARQEVEIAMKEWKHMKGRGSIGVRIVRE